MYDYVYMYRKKCDIDLYGDNIVHWIYRMIFVFRVWLSDGWKLIILQKASKRTAAISFCFVKIILLVWFYFYTDHSSNYFNCSPPKRFKKRDVMHFDNKIILMVMYFENDRCDVSFKGVTGVFCRSQRPQRGSLLSFTCHWVTSFCIMTVVVWLFDSQLLFVVSPSRVRSLAPVNSSSGVCLTSRSQDIWKFKDACHADGSPLGQDTNMCLDFSTGAAL